jgi:hypothetical protein
MPIYTCTIRESILGTDRDAALAREMACELDAPKCDLRHKCVD